MNNSEFFGQIRRGFASLMQFSGRDRRGQFWPYAAFVLLVTQAIAAAVIVPTLVSQIATIVERTERMVRDNPQDWVVERSAGSVHYQYVGNDPAVLTTMIPDLSALWWAIVATSVLTVLLLAAAVTRRLHDRGHSGLWALVPTLLLALGLWIFSSLFGGFNGGDKMASALPAFVAAFMVNLAYVAALMVLAVQLACATKPQDNRFGQPPIA